MHSRSFASIRMKYIFKSCYSIRQGCLINGRACWDGKYRVGEGIGRTEIYLLNIFGFVFLVDLSNVIISTPKNTSPL
jgi:hypothetical protein